MYPLKCKKPKTSKQPKNKQTKLKNKTKTKQNNNNNNRRADRQVGCHNEINLHDRFKNRFDFKICPPSSIFCNPNDPLSDLDDILQCISPPHDRL